MEREVTGQRRGDLCRARAAWKNGETSKMIRIDVAKVAYTSLRLSMTPTCSLRARAARHGAGEKVVFNRFAASRAEASTWRSWHVGDLVGGAMPRGGLVSHRPSAAGL